MKAVMAMIVLALILFVVFWSLLIMILSPVLFKPVKPIYGASFSTEYAQQLDLDWQQAFAALLDDMKLKHLRLMSYWSQIEPVDGQFDFADLDWQFEQATKRGANVSLVVGLRQPRWPECRQPAWANQLSRDERNQQLYQYIETTVNRYKNHPALVSWQLENEAVNRHFGECEAPDKDRLQVEYDLMKRLDSSRPIIMSLSDQHGLPLGKPVPDVYGFSVYRIFYNWQFYKGYAIFPTPIWYHRLRAALIRSIHHKPIIIHELQAEPWGPDSIQNLSTEEQHKSMNVKQLKKNLEFASSTGIKKQYLWGAEWWYWRWQQGDTSIWDTIQKAING